MIGVVVLPCFLNLDYSKSGHFDLIFLLLLFLVFFMFSFRRHWLTQIIADFYLPDYNLIWLIVYLLIRVFTVCLLMKKNRILRLFSISSSASVCWRIRILFTFIWSMFANALSRCLNI